MNKPKAQYGHGNPFAEMWATRDAAAVSPPPGFDQTHVLVQSKLGTSLLPLPRPSPLEQYRAAYHTLLDLRIGDNGLPEENKFTALAMLEMRDAISSGISNLGRKPGRDDVLAEGNYLIQDMQRMIRELGDAKARDRAYNEAIAYLRRLHGHLLFVYDALATAVASNIKNARALPTDTFLELNRQAHFAIREMISLNAFRRNNSDIDCDEIPGYAVVARVGRAACMDLYDFGIFAMRYCFPPASTYCDIKLC